MAERGAGVWLAGTGLLAGAIAASVSIPDPPVLVTASDAWALPDRAGVREQAAARGCGWLPVRTELSEVVIGPWEVPDRPGCVTCAESRRARVRPDRAGRAAVRQAHRDALAARPAAWLTGLAAELVASLVAGEVTTIDAGGTPATRTALLRVELAELAVSRHPFLPDPACPDCGRLPDDSPEAAQLTLLPRPAYRPGSYRVRQVIDELDELTARYVDEQAGLIRSLEEWRDGTQVLVRAPLAMRVDAPVEGYGRSGTSRGSRLIALLEALERYGCTPAARRTVVRASYAEVRDRAVDPRTLGLHAPEQYAQPGFPFQPFHVDKPYRWVWGWSFARRGPVLVPEPVAYYGPPLDHDHEHDDRPFTFEVSNGCALGGCLEEAILYALLEVAERDAFLLMWYARLAAPKVDLATATNPALALLAAGIAASSGLTVRVYDISVEQGIPCACAVAVDPEPDGGRPALALATGSHPDPERAIHNALTELGPSLTRLRYDIAEPESAERARAMVTDPDRVRDMADHSLLYAHPAVIGRVEFLTGSTRRTTVAGVGEPDRGGFASVDLRDNLLEAVDRFTRHGLDVVVVDQTVAEHRASGLTCVKVLVPGTLPMTFGHRFRRTHGLSRLFHVPKLLGYTDRPLTPAELNPHPHPFP